MCLAMLLWLPQARQPGHLLPRHLCIKSHLTTQTFVLLMIAVVLFLSSHTTPQVFSTSTKERGHKAALKFKEKSS